MCEFLKNDNLRETKDFKCKVKALPDVHAILKIGRRALNLGWIAEKKCNLWL